MNLGQLKTNIKRQFGDESSVQVTDEDIVRWLEIAQETVVIENEGILDARTTVNVVGNQDEYPLPDDLLTIRSLWVKENNQQQAFNPVPFYTTTQFEKLVGSHIHLNSNGILSAYVYTTYENTIFLWPLPKNDVDDGLRILYGKKPDMPTSDVDVLGLPLQYHNAIMNHCLVQAYEMDENWEASNNKLAQFQNAINRQANRSAAEARQTYPTITVLPEDM